jgi:hypothetical protein
MSAYEDRISDILTNADTYHAAFNEVATFSRFIAMRMHEHFGYR